MYDFTMYDFNIYDDYYEILNVESDATIEQISKNYRNLARKHHPDHGGNSDMFELLSKAYECLSNKKMKEQYDLFRLNNNYKETENQHTLDYFRNEYEKFEMENKKPLNKEEIDNLYDKIFAAPIKDEKLNNNDFEEKIKNREAERNMYDIEDTDDYLKNLIERENINVNDVYEYMKDKQKETKIIQTNVMTQDLMPNNNMTYSLFDEQYSNIAEPSHNSCFNNDNINLETVKKDFDIDNFKKWKKDKTNKENQILTEENFKTLLKQRELETNEIMNDVKNNFKNYEKMEEIKNFMKIENDINLDDLKINNTN